MQPLRSFCPCSLVFRISSLLFSPASMSLLRFAPFRQRLFSASLPFFSHVTSFFSHHLICLTLPLPLREAGSPRSFRPPVGSVPGPSVRLSLVEGRLWEGAHTPPRRAPLRCCPSPVLPALRSLRFGLLFSVSKVTPTASLSSPELPVGFPGTVHCLGFVLPCFSRLSRAFRAEGWLPHPPLGEHPSRLVKGEASASLRTNAPVTQG